MAFASIAIAQPHWQTLSSTAIKSLMLRCGLDAAPPVLIQNPLYSYIADFPQSTSSGADRKAKARLGGTESCSPLERNPKVNSFSCTAAKTCCQETSSFLLPPERINFGLLNGYGASSAACYHHTILVLMKTIQGISYMTQFHLISYSFICHKFSL